MTPTSLAPSLAPDSSPSGFEPRDLLGADEATARAALLELAACRSKDPERTEIETKAFSDCSYLNFKELGLQLRLKPAADGKVDVVFMYNEGVQGFSGYQGELPEGLEWSFVSRDVVKLLGEPSDKYGGGRFLPVGISYELQGLDIQFADKDWDDGQNPLAYVSVFQALEAHHGMCEVCGKRATMRCGLCRNHRYCSSKCQKAEWSKHQLQCPGHLAKLKAAAEAADAAAAEGAEAAEAPKPEAAEGAEAVKAPKQAVEASPDASFQAEAATHVGSPILESMD
ncbi:unnamed protein product [Polarella glacialis]|uniref:MYND-type domain-containing protein n=1 Tax=Polarella glacialis TaxID=89957 RepID=A0A813HTH6_POLGL|nr:unnamed protein product [Polarella glacialis]